MVCQTQQGLELTWAAPEIATRLVTHYKLTPSRMLYIERDLQSQAEDSIQALYYLVTFVWQGEQATRPDWHYLSADTCRSLFRWMSHH
ncbi:hypothetical protein GCM10027085_10220 [Spirosoma aerophilum]